MWGRRARSPPQATTTDSTPWLLDTAISGETISAASNSLQSFSNTPAPHVGRSGQFEKMANVQDHGPPSAAAIAVSTAIIAGITGYYIGQARSIGLFAKPGTRPPAAPLAQESDISDADAASSGDDEDEEDDLQDLGELKTFSDTAEECKLVLVVRTDLGMGKGMWREVGVWLLLLVYVSYRLSRAA